MTIRALKLNAPVMSNAVNSSIVQNSKTMQMNDTAQKSETIDKVEFTSHVEENTPIRFKEGIKLFGEGFTRKLKGIVSAVIKHPVKTAAVIGGTAALMAALPLIGIPTVAAGSALTLLYAGMAVGKTAYHGAKFIKNNHNKNYSQARENLKSMGGDSLDLALTLPFVPKAIKNTKNFVQLGKAGINSGLINDIKKAKGFSNKFKALKNGNVKITEDINFNKAVSKYCKTAEDAAEFQAMRELPAEEFTKQVYTKITKDMGIADCAPEMKISGSMLKNDLGGFSAGDCSIQFNAEEFKTMKQSDIINTVRHELEHYKQFTDIARYKGADYIPELNARSYLQRLKNRKSYSWADGLNKEFIKNNGEEAFIQQYIEQHKDTIETYQKITDKMGIIKEGTPEAAQAEKYIESVINYPDMSFCIFSVPDSYTNNLLEVEARKAGANPSGKIGEYKHFAEAVEKVYDTFFNDIILAANQGAAFTVKNNEN